VLAGASKGYPQVGTFVKHDWAVAHRDVINRLNQELEKALQLIQENPQQAVTLTKDFFKFPEKILLASLKKTDFHLSTSEELKQQIAQYYQVLGNPLDETFDAFFYLDPQ
jgi:ABC-type nitrate/sulfonate/bicarbonate transport system substrate-binding protein